MINTARRHTRAAMALLAAALLAGCAAAPQKLDVTMRTPSVETGNPQKSFWRDQVTYPFPVHYATAADTRGVEWQIAYMDEYAGSGAREQAPALVLVHGKGANAGYFSELMKAALEAGLRVVAFDLPNYGKSIPGNLDKPLTRTLEDTRVAAHHLLVEQLGIDKAAYLGHSLGGQWVVGYALDYPEAVSKLILESPSGLEEYPTAIRLPSGVDWPIFDPGYKYDYAGWEKIWGPLGHLRSEFAKTERDIRAFYYFKQVDPKTGELKPSKVGYFVNDSPDARFLTETRVQMIKGSPKEYERYVITYIRDVYSLGIEVRKEDPNSLYKRLDEITAPVLIVFGDRDPFIPTSVLSGLTDLRTQIIQPAYEKLARHGAKPVVAVYAGAGHFVHTDYPERFARDVIQFTDEGTIASPAENPMGYGAAAVPDAVKAFARRDEAAFAGGDLDAIMANYHPDYLDSGRDRQAQRDVMKQFLGMTETYEVIIDTFKPVGEDKGIISGGIKSDLGTLPFPDGAMIIREGDRWYWYGNQKRN